MRIAQGVLPFKLEVSDEDKECLTAHAALPLVVELMRKLFSAREHKRLSKALGYARWKTARRHLESLVLLIVAGGDCLDDLQVLRADAGLMSLIGYELSSPSQAKDFLYRFHQAEEGSLLNEADDTRLSVTGKAKIRPEGPGLKQLLRMVDRSVETIQGMRTRTGATIDVDATIVEANKKQALRAYEGTRGFQPQGAWWAEQGVWVFDQFRDGNVPAAYEATKLLQLVFERLPCSPTHRRLRADTALYDEKALTWAADKGGIEFAVSADMSEGLREQIEALPNEAWRPYRSRRQHEESSEEREWAEVSFVPGWARNHKKAGTPFRYIAIRVRGRQRDLLENDGTRWRHFAVVTNMSWDGERLLQWHREKQGTVEHANGVVKNELAAGTLPCGRFGANAAWWRINVLAHNLLEALKVAGLPQELRRARPKQLRFRLFNVAGRVLHTGRQLFLRISSRLPAAQVFAKAREAILRLSPAPG